MVAIAQRLAYLFGRRAQRCSKVSRPEKLLQRFQAKPKDFTWAELVKLLNYLGYEESTRGRTAGSRRRFVHSCGALVLMHKPHPGNVVRSYAIEQLHDQLSKEGFL